MLPDDNVQKVLGPQMVIRRFGHYDHDDQLSRELMIQVVDLLT